MDHCYASAVVLYDAIRDHEFREHDGHSPRITLDCTMGYFQRCASIREDPDAAGTGHIVNDEVIEVDVTWWGCSDINRGAAIGIDARPLDAREADRFADGHGLVIGGVERLNLAARPQFG